MKNKSEPRHESMPDNRNVQLTPNTSGSNLETLNIQMIQLGFGEIFSDLLAVEMQKGTPDFTFNYRSLMADDVVACELKFARSANGYYFWDQYTIDLPYTLDSNGSAIRKQTINVEYYDTADTTLTLEESYNLLKGRWVNKRLAFKDHVSSRWAKINFNHILPGENYERIILTKNSFNVVQLVDNLPLIEYGNHKTKADFINAINRGNEVEGTLKLSTGAKEKFKFECNPEKEQLEVYQGKRRVNISKEGKLSFPELRKGTSQSKGLHSPMADHPLQKERKRKSIKR